MNYPTPIRSRIVTRFTYFHFFINNSFAIFTALFIFCACMPITSNAQALYTAAPSPELLETVTQNQAQMIDRNFDNGLITVKEKQLLADNLGRIKKQLENAKNSIPLNEMQLKRLRTELTVNYKLTSKLAKNSDLYVARQSS